MGSHSERAGKHVCHLHLHSWLAVLGAQAALHDAPCGLTRCMCAVCCSPTHLAPLRQQQPLQQHWHDVRQQRQHCVAVGLQYSISLSAQLRFLPPDSPCCNSKEHRTQHLGAAAACIQPSMPAQLLGKRCAMPCRPSAATTTACCCTVLHGAHKVCREASSAAINLLQGITTLVTDWASMPQACLRLHTSSSCVNRATAISLPVSEASSNLLSSALPSWSSKMAPSWHEPVASGLLHSFCSSEGVGELGSAMRLAVEMQQLVSGMIR